MIELGLQGFYRRDRAVLFCARQDAADIVEKLAAKSIEVLKEPAVVAQLRANGYEVVTHGPEGLRKYIETEVPKWRDVIAKAGIKPV